MSAPEELPDVVELSPQMRLGELIREAEKRGYHVVMRLRPNTCPHGSPCCEACKALPENEHSVTVIG